MPARSSRNFRAFLLVYEASVLIVKSALRFALGNINAQFGVVENIVHTSAVVNDATITSTYVAGFEHVLRPKTIGSWNLHASQDLNLRLE